MCESFDIFSRYLKKRRTPVFFSMWFILKEYWSNWRLLSEECGAAGVEFSMEMLIIDLVVSFHATYTYWIKYLKILIRRFT